MFMSAISMAAILLIHPGCSHEHGVGTHTHGDESHQMSLEPLAFTVWTSKSELFVEFPPLVVGKSSRFAAHFSRMEDFKAVEKGKVMIRLREGNQMIAEDVVSEPASPGIFRPSLTPEKAGKYTLDFILMTDTYNDTISLNDVAVYLNEEDAINANPPAPDGDEISFLKEQAWKIDFAISQVRRQPIRHVIHTSGEILPIKGEEKIIAAKSSGIVFFKSKKLQEGREIAKGEVLFTISSKGLVESNLEEKFLVAQARVEKTKTDYDRAERLLEEQVIGQKEYERRKMDYAIAEAEFQTLAESYTAGGQAVSASMPGVIKHVMVSDGQFVQEGTPLVEITNTRRLLLQAQVSQHYSPILHLITTANFKTTYQDEVQSLDDYNGRLISYGKMMDRGSSFIPVLFELDNLHDLLPGSYVELFLLTNTSEKELVVPKMALMQDYNLNYVYVQVSGESFEKREVRLGIDDGVNVQILSGVFEGEWVVTKGAYQIKMASMSSTIPAHGHEH